MSSVEPNHSSSEVNCTEKVEFELVIVGGDRTQSGGQFTESKTHSQP
ncbi:hypothetical protein [Nostoc sp.]